MLKGDLSSPAFSLKRKTVDVPPVLAPHFARPDLLPTNDVGDIRVTQPIEDYQVQLLLGLDNVAWGPKEETRFADESGQLILYRSYISSQLLLSGSRRTGPGSTTTNDVGQRRYLIKEEGSDVSLIRSGIQTQDFRNLFNVDSRKNCSKIEKLFFQHFEDQNLLPVASPSCDSCQGCQICADPFKA